MKAVRIFLIAGAMLFGLAALRLVDIHILHPEKSVAWDAKLAVEAQTKAAEAQALADPNRRLGNGMTKAEWDAATRAEWLAGFNGPVHNMPDCDPSHPCPH
jgi:hypothetical protein